MRFLDWFLLLFIFTFTIPRSVEAQNRAEFISLDCGLVPENTTYVENTIIITYKSDADYIDSGSVGKIKDAYTTQFQRQLWSLRSFPDGKRNCYNVNVTANSKYLIRGSFVYGNYDGLNQLPSFDLHIGPNKWSSVTIEGVANFSMTEIIHVVTQERLQVCLVKTGPTTPFISSLELRPLPNQSYVTETGSLTRFARVFFSTSSSVISQYKTEQCSQQKKKTGSQSRTSGAAPEPCLNHDKSCGHEENRLQTGSRRKRISFQTSLQYTHDIKTYSLISFATTHRQQRVVMFKMSIIEDQVSDIPSLRKLNLAYQQLSLVSKLVFSVGHIIHEEENRIVREEENSS
ncbi:hypothetical protein YC2023_075719 [Brassica napus]